MVKWLNKIIFLTALLVVASCSFADNNTISDSQFVMLYVDLSFAAEQFLSDSVQLAGIQDSIFETHSVTRKDFDAYKAELDKSPERWSEIWRMVADELEKREERLQRTKTAQDNKSKD